MYYSRANLLLLAMIILQLASYSESCECSASHAIYAVDYTGSMRITTDSAGLNGWDKTKLLLEDTKDIFNFLSVYYFGYYQGSAYPSMIDLVTRVDPSTFTPSTMVQPGYWDSTYDEAFKKAVNILDNYQHEDQLTIMIVSDGTEEFTQQWSDRLVQAMN